VEQHLDSSDLVVILVVIYFNKPFPAKATDLCY